MRIADLIYPFRNIETPPPQTLGAFIRWSLSGAWPMLFVAAFFSAIAGAMEAVTAWILGRVIDVATASGPENFLTAANMWMILGAVAFFMLLRPSCLACHPCRTTTLSCQTSHLWFWPS